MKSIFRIATAAYAFSMITVVVIIFAVGPGEIPEPASAYLAWWYSQPQSRIEFLIGQVTMIAVSLSVITALGMVFFLRWCRPLFAASIAVLLSSEGFMDYPVLKTPIEYQMDTLAGILAGGVIAMSYWSSISGEFCARKS